MLPFLAHYCHLLIGGIMCFLMVVRKDPLIKTSYTHGLWYMSLISPQHSGRFYEELPNTADYVSYRLACNKEDYPEPYSPPINPPLSFLPQHPYPSSQPTSGSSTTTTSKNTFSPPSHTTAIFRYPSVQGLSSPPPGVAAYTFPKEQYVWTLLQTLQWTQNPIRTITLTQEEVVVKPWTIRRCLCTVCTVVDDSGSQRTCSSCFWTWCPVFKNTFSLVSGL